MYSRKPPNIAPRIFADKACEAEFNLEISLEKARPENKSGKVRTNGNSILNIFWLKKKNHILKKNNQLLMIKIKEYKSL